MAGFSVVISATDRLTGTLDKINKKAQGFSAPFEKAQKSLAKFGEVSGLNKVADGFSGIARSGRDAFDKLSQVVAPLGAITGAASLAGMYRMVATWSEWGTKLGFAAQNMNVTASALSNMQGAARLAGASTESLTSGMQTLGQTMFDAIGGRAPEAVVMFNTLGVSFKTAGHHARGVTEVLPELADKIAALKDPYAQARAATALFGGAGAELLPFLRRGSVGIKEYLAEVERLNPVTQQSIDAANQFRTSQTGLTLAIEGLGNRISTGLSPAISPLLDKLRDWIATSPQVQSGIDQLGQGVGRLSVWLQGVNWSRVEADVVGFGHVIGDVVEDLGGLRGLLRDLELYAAARLGITLARPFLMMGAAALTATARVTGLAAAERAAATAAGLSARLPLIGAAALAAGAGLDAVDPNDRMGSWIDRNLPGASFVDNAAGQVGVGRTYAQQRAVDPASRAGLNAQAPAAYKAGGILGDLGGASQAQYDAFREGVASIEKARYNQMGGSSGRFAGRYQMGADEIKEAAQFAGLPAPTRAQFLANPALQERLFEAYTDQHLRTLDSKSPAFKGASVQEKLAYLGYAHNQGAGGAASWLAGGAIGHDAFGTSGTAYSKRVMALETALPASASGPAVAVAQGPAAQVASDGSDGDSSSSSSAGGTINLRIRHDNAPPPGFDIGLLPGSSVGGSQVAMANTTGVLP